MTVEERIKLEHYFEDEMMKVINPDEAIYVLADILFALKDACYDANMNYDVDEDYISIYDGLKLLEQINSKAVHEKYHKDIEELESKLAEKDN